MDTDYGLLEDAPEASAAPARPLRRVWAPVALGMGLTLAAAVPLTLLRQTKLPDPTAQRLVQVPSLSAMPTACDGWAQRCLAGAAAAEAQTLGRFWPSALCADGAKLSCANRAAVWASPSLALPPNLDPDPVTPEDIATAPSGALVLFLPGTGTPPAAVGALLEAAADMGHHVLGLSYAALPIAVSQLDLWCTRPGVDAAKCNVQLHEGVLFGREAPGGDAPWTDETGGVWPVLPEESVAALAASALRALGWTQYLRHDNQTVAWERVVVAGHSQGAGHAAYLSVVRPVRAAVLFSGPQEGTQNGRAWIRPDGVAGGGGGGGGGGGEGPIRRAAFGLREECGDTPYAADSYCAALFPGGLQRKNLGALGLQPGLMGNSSGFVVLDYTPLQLGVGRSHHESIALGKQAPPAVVAIWKTLFAAL